MSKEEFGRDYADQYDLLYGDKDYEVECDLLEEVFRRYSNFPIGSILDLGCGTGNHAIPLGRRGYNVTGVDLSADMLVHAHKKAESELRLRQGQSATFLRGDIRNIDLNQKFDSVIMMFSVLGLQTTNADVFAALHTVRKHLRPAGIFACDVWYGPAVLKIRPSDRIKVVPTEDGQLIRTATGSLDTFRHLTGVHFHIWRLSNSRLVGEANEIQWTRFFFPQELSFYMEQAKLELIVMCAFGNLDKPPSEDTWNILVAGKAV